MPDPSYTKPDTTYLESRPRTRPHALGQQVQQQQQPHLRREEEAKKAAEAESAKRSEESQRLREEARRARLEDETRIRELERRAEQERQLRLQKEEELERVAEQERLLRLQKEQVVGGRARREGGREGGQRFCVDGLTCVHASALACFGAFDDTRRRMRSRLSATHSCARSISKKRCVERSMYCVASIEQVCRA